MMYVVVNYSKVCGFFDIVGCVWSWATGSGVVRTGYECVRDDGVFF